MRKLADLYFLMRMYKPAYNYAYISKKDFQTDEVDSLKSLFLNVSLIRLGLTKPYFDLCFIMLVQRVFNVSLTRLGLTMQLLLN